MVRPRWRDEYDDRRRQGRGDLRLQASIQSGCDSRWRGVGARATSLPSESCSSALARQRSSQAEARGLRVVTSSRAAARLVGRVDLALAAAISFIAIATLIPKTGLQTTPTFWCALCDDRATVDIVLNVLL